MKKNFTNIFWAISNIDVGVDVKDYFNIISHKKMYVLYPYGTIHKHAS